MPIHIFHGDITSGALLLKKEGDIIMNIIHIICSRHALVASVLVYSPDLLFDLSTTGKWLSMYFTAASRSASSKLFGRVFVTVAFT